MYEKFKLKILNNSRLNFGIKNDVCSHFLLKCSGGSFQTYKVLEIFNMNKENVIA